MKNKRIQLTTPSQPGAENFNRVNRQCRKCFPVTKEFREQLHSAVLDAYQQAISQNQAPVEHQEQPEVAQSDMQMGGM